MSNVASGTTSAGRLTGAAVQPRRVASGVAPIFAAIRLGRIATDGHDGPRGVDGVEAVTNRESAHRLAGTEGARLRTEMNRTEARIAVARDRRRTRRQIFVTHQRPRARARAVVLTRVDVLVAGRGMRGTEVRVGATIFGRRVARLVDLAISRIVSGAALGLGLRCLVDDLGLCIAGRVRRRRVRAPSSRPPPVSAAGGLTVELLLVHAAEAAATANVTTTGGRKRGRCMAA